MHPTSFNSPSDAKAMEALERIAQRYRDEGYDVVVHPGAHQVPEPIRGFEPDLIATRGNEGVVVGVKEDRGDVASDSRLAHLAEILNAWPGWRLDLVVLEAEPPEERVARDADEPSDDQLAEILRTADELADKGYAPYACVVAWSGMEAALRRLRADEHTRRRSTPNELMRSLYGDGTISREQFETLRESFKVRSQVVHGLVPPHFDSQLVHRVTATARDLVFVH
jgi:hypothetical protein